MLFNSYDYILVFLPAVAVGYFLVCRSTFAVYAQLFLALASVVFYGAWNPKYVPLILGSVVFNFFVSRAIYAQREDRAVSKRLLVLGVVANLALLGYFKYVDFFIQNINLLSGSQIALVHIVLPLGISFFTFTQIAFLVDTYRGQGSHPSFINYTLFVTYFPHLLAGPILHHREMMPQFADVQNRRPNHDNLARGLYLFSLGLAKKVVLADSLAEIADAGFKQPGNWGLVDAWMIALAYSLQLYFDFSGYTDMALGAARVFNIRLPINFDSPYRATSIQDFWHRWHITLSRFLREYVYIPLGGNRTGELVKARNVMITFVLGGLWHGAGWTFVVWGALHGAAMVTQMGWRRIGLTLPSWLAWLITFAFVNVAWVFFRAPSIHDAIELTKGMAGLRGVGMPMAGPFEILLIAIALFISLKGSTSNVWVETRTLDLRNAAAFSIVFAIGFLSLNQTSPFIYFNF